MSLPTLTECYDQTRAKCGDTEVSGGQIYTNTLLLPHIQEATRALWRGLRNLAVPRVRRTFFYTLPANTNTFYPATAGITDFSEPSGPVAQRGSLTSVAVSTAAQSGNNLAVTTTGAHGRATGDMVVLEQIVGLKGANVLASITVTGASTFTANGVLATGVYVSGGLVVTSSNEFSDLVWAQSVPSSTTQSSAGLNSCVYAGGYFQFAPSNDARQLRVQYWSSASIPAVGADQIGFDDCIDFIATYAAAKASKAMGADDRAAWLLNDAVGPEFNRGVIGGELRQLMIAAVRQIQNLPPYERGPAPFREQTDNLNYI